MLDVRENIKYKHNKSQVTNNVRWPYIDKQNKNNLKKYKRKYKYHKDQNKIKQKQTKINNQDKEIL